MAYSPAGSAGELDVERELACAQDLTADPPNSSPETENEMRQAVLNYGGSPFSFDAFEVPEKYRWFGFEGKHGRGGIAYKEAYRTRVIVGDPLLREADWGDAMTAFLSATPPFTAAVATFASAKFAEVAHATRGAVIEAQNAVSLNPQTWDLSGPKTAQIRNYARKPAKLGLELVEMKLKKEPDPWFRDAAEVLVADWLRNSLKKDGNAHEVNLWAASEYKRYFALLDPTTNKLHALVVARPLPAHQGYYLWSARASDCANGALEATIEYAVRTLREERVTYLTFGPFQAVRPHTYIGDSGGTILSRWILGQIVPIYFEKSGYAKTMNFFKKFDFDDSENIYNLIWPRRSWIRPHLALNKLFNGKRKRAE